MVASAKIAYSARRQTEYGVSVPGNGEVSVDMSVVRKRKRDMVSSFRGGSEGRLEKAENVSLVRGTATFVDAKEILVHRSGDADGTERLKADWVFINVGCRPATLNIPGADEVDVLDSTSVMELDVVPEHLIVMGGGYVGLEFAQMFRRFGSQVTVVQRGSQLMGREDEDVADAVREVLVEDGVEVLLEARAERVENMGKGKVKIIVRIKDEEREIMGSHILSAAGRVPNTTDLGLEKTGVKLSKGGYIEVNERLETNVNGVYTLGDVKGGPAFTQ